jgi:glucokinase
VNDGRIYAGAQRAALSIGQLIVERHGTACHGGAAGRLECYASSPALLRLYNESVSATRQVTDGEAIMRAVQAGEPEALTAVETVSDWLGFGLSNVLNILNPAVVAVGGGVAQLGAPFFEALNQSIQRYAYSTVRSTPILPALMGANAGLVQRHCCARLVR